jgi:mevalonate kinase
MILIGEYSVLEGGTSIVMAINRYCRITFKPSKNRDFILNSPILNISDLRFRIKKNKTIEFKIELSENLKEKLIFFTRTFELFLTEVNTVNRLPEFEITIDTGQFFVNKAKSKLGLGSSAALSTGLVHGLLFVVKSLYKTAVPPAELFNLAQKIHYLSQDKKGSGIDIAASCYGGVISFQKQNSTTIKKLTLPEELIILPVWSGVSESTRDLVDKVTKFKMKRHDEYETIMVNLKRFSAEADNLLEKKDVPGFLTSCGKFFENLKKLGIESETNIVSSLHQEIANIAHAEGAVYKPSGAGGGDIGLIMTNSKTISNNVSDYILSSKFQLLNLNIAKKGSYIKFI